MVAAVLPNVVWRIAFPCCITEEGILGVLQCSLMYIPISFWKHYYFLGFLVASLKLSQNQIESPINRT